MNGEKYRVVPIAQDPNKVRLKELKAKLKAKQPGKNSLTPQELEEAVERIMDHLKIGDI